MSFQQLSVNNIDIFGQVNGRAATDVVLPPEAGASSGYVLTLDGSLHPEWAAPTGGSGSAGPANAVQVSDGSGGFLAGPVALDPSGNITGVSNLHVNVSGDTQITPDGGVLIAPTGAIHIGNAGTPLWTLPKSTAPSFLGQALCVVPAFPGGANTAWATPGTATQPWTVYVSNKYGNDSFDASFLFPKQSIHAALTLAGITSPTSTVSIVILDGAVYDETLTISSTQFPGGIVIWGPAAHLNPTSSVAPALTIDGAACAITLGEISSVSFSSAVVVTGGAPCRLRFDASISGAFTQSGTGLMTIDAGVVAGVIDNSAATGTIVATVANLLGSTSGTVNSPSTSGLTPL
jgi:hypothetical protein